MYFMLSGGRSPARSQDHRRHVSAGCGSDGDRNSLAGNQMESGRSPTHFPPGPVGERGWVPQRGCRKSQLKNPRNGAILRAPDSLEACSWVGIAKDSFGAFLILMLKRSKNNRHVVIGSSLARKNMLRPALSDEIACFVMIGLRRWAMRDRGTCSSPASR